MNDAGKLITFEGLDGCGKTTHLELEARRLRQQGVAVVTTREPGGTPVGKQIRDVVLSANRDEMTALTELALMFAARAQHIAQVILPALQAGQLVLCDRFTDSTIAYQGYGRGVPLEVIRQLETVFCQGVRPDLTLLLEVNPATALNRTAARHRAGKSPASRFENEGLAFFERVREGYQRIARQEPGRVRRVEATADIPVVHEQVHHCVEEFLKNVPGEGSHGL